MGTVLLLLASFGTSAAGSLFAWACLFHWDVEGKWEAWRLHRGKRLTRRQERAAREFEEDPRHRW